MTTFIKCNKTDQSHYKRPRALTINFIKTCWLEWSSINRTQELLDLRELDLAKLALIIK